MIYIKIDTNSIQSISIPRYFNEKPNGVRLKLINNLTEQVIEIEPKNFYVAEPYIQLDIQLKDKIVEGEYSYNLIDTERGVINFGIAVVGDYKPSNIKSYGDTNKKIQYNR